MTKSLTRRLTNNDGYVALAVLVIAGLLAAFVSTLVAVSRPAIGLARLGADAIAVDALLQGGLETAGYLLFRGEREPETVDGMTLPFASGTVDLKVIDEGARVSLNAAEEDLLSGLFSTVGGNSMSASAFAARVLDWRDEDSDILVDGAESGDYASAGLTYSPRNGRFRSSDELRYLLGLSARDFARLEPYVTVYQNTGLVDPLTASRTVLTAVPGMQKSDVDKLIEAREGGVTDREELIGDLEEPFDYFDVEPSGVYRVIVRARLKSGISQAAEAVIIASEDEASDYGVVAWSPLAADAARRS